MKQLLFLLVFIQLYSNEKVVFEVFYFPHPGCSVFICSLAHLLLLLLGIIKEYKCSTEHHGLS